ncbi:hypothetical protein SAY86_006138 [Trapa natans]|uniref:LOB domain-containing protein n=1 Tax=Trapa natans TaxID=22666 RepID=A0AAN7QWH9_TRANT|nr:hypothetical protein SAY86_006138 [Trapa natans]
MTGRTSNACAACKYQRRKCKPECQLSQYFPSHQPSVFKNVHKLFGVKNVLSILKNIQNPNQKDDAMTSIIYEANMRKMFPVRGCCHLIDAYSAEVKLLEEELRAVRSQIEFYRNQPYNQHPTPPSTSSLWFDSQAMTPPSTYLQSYQTDGLQGAGIVQNHEDVHPTPDFIDDNSNQFYI